MNGFVLIVRQLYIIKKKILFVKKLIYPKFFYSYEDESRDSICPICNYKNTSHRILTIKNSEIIACKNCQNARTYPPPVFNEYEEDDFHGDLSINHLDDLPKQWREGIIKQILLIKANIKPFSKILEIGSGRGLMLKELVNLGYDAIGIEPSKAASRAACQAGLNVVNGYFPSPQLANQQYDLIIMTHVLEHIKDIDKVLKEILNSLNDTGKILLVQTNWKGIMPRYEKTEWHGWAIDQHYWHFSPEGISYILQNAGFKIEKIDYYSLEHSSKPISKIGILMPSFFDQFQVLARKNIKQI